MKSSKVCITTKSTLASLLFKGLATKHTTVKWSIATSSLLVFSSAGSNLPTLTHSLYHLVLLTGTSQFFSFFVCLFVIFEDKC